MAFRTSILEVERKFCGLAVAELTAKTGHPPFTSLKSLPPCRLHDTYFDRQNILSSAGVWVRRRNGQWQAKIKRGGNFDNSQFEELSDPQQISQYVNHLTGLKQDADRKFGLEEIARLSTLRRTWIANEDFHIVLDSIDFGHTVGEVELQQEATFDESSQIPVREQARRVMEEMDKRIEDFMGSYSWAFRSGKPIGKLTAYFEKQRKQGL